MLDASFLRCHFAEAAAAQRLLARTNGQRQIKRKKHHDDTIRKEGRTEVWGEHSLVVRNMTLIILSSA
jgi:hypothetical protein